MLSFPSHVPYDSIRELVEAMLKILDDYPEAIVRWNDEPAEHQFVFMSEGERVNFKVYEMLIPSSLAGRAILRSFWKGLREMQSRQSLEEYERRWHEPFPEREMVELTRRIKEIKLNGFGVGAV